jgi:TatD DNase family protein
MLVDSHCHLNFPDFKDDLESVIARSTEAGVTHLQTICTKLEEYESIKEITDKFTNIWCSIGIHPHEANSFTPDLRDFLVKNIKEHKKTIGLGETGLDYYYNHSDKALQKKSFIAHIEASQITKAPVIIHTRDAELDTLDILRSEKKNIDFPALIHCFTASRDFAYACLDLGIYISVSGIVTFKKSTELQETIKTIPSKSLLVETDAPYLAPTPHRGSRNEPAFTAITAKFISDLKQEEYESFCKQTTENFFSLFGKAKI